MFPIDGSWPQDCPPDDAVASNDEVYRVVRGNPCEPSDFRSFAETGRKTSDKCKGCGLSVFPTLATAIHNLQLFPGLGSFVARAKLQPEHGKILKTPTKNNPEHLTWWIAHAVSDRAAMFKVISE